jgi:hypothetical protein
VSKSLACCISYRYFFASGGIEQRPALLDGGAQVRVYDRRLDHQVHRPAEELLQSFHQPEVAVGVAGSGRRIELDQEVQVAALGPEGAGRRGAEYFKPAHAIATAQIVQLTAACNDFMNHLETSNQQRSLAAIRAADRIKG